MYTIFVERKTGCDLEAHEYLTELRDFLGVHGLESLRYFNRYEIDGIDSDTFKKSITTVFADPQTDNYYIDKIDTDDTVIMWEYLPGQFDQRADAAVQCLTLMANTGNLHGTKIKVHCTKVVALKGDITYNDIKHIQSYLVNPVDSRLITNPTNKINENSDFGNTDGTKNGLNKDTKDNGNSSVKICSGFINYSDSKIASFVDSMGLAMDDLDACAMRDYFKSVGRDPTITEVRVLDTYWSDHCRHTTFLTHLDDFEIEDGAYKDEFDAALALYKDSVACVYGENSRRSTTLMDIATIGGKLQKKLGILDDAEDSEENNACSLVINVDTKNNKTSEESTQEYLLMFKNETHNHPTEIEPFGGAATCIGGAIRDPLSGRSYVYQSMRVTGAGDPTKKISQTLKGKLPQQKICRGAAKGFSSYGNQVGLATGQVAEYYHEGFVAKRLETGAVIAAAPRNIVRRERPTAGDIVILLGGGTGRDGIGGATGSSKMHTKNSVETMASEVQKGNAPEERKIQRLFRNPVISMMIKRSNDFGAGGVSVAIGELAAGLEIDLDKVPKKYEGLDGTELAISESQERMAVVVDKKDVDNFINEAKKENLTATAVATVTNNSRLVMKWQGKTIVDIARNFLDTAGATHHTKVIIEEPAKSELSPLNNPLFAVEQAAFKSDGNCEDPTHSKNDYSAITPGTLKKMWLSNIADLACCAKTGLIERFDSTIGSGTVLFPLGGKNQKTVECGMVSLIPAGLDEETTTASIMTHGYDPRLSNWSAYHGAIFAVLDSLTKIACLGGKVSRARLSFQEFFGRARDPRRFGYPAAALLGGLLAQIKTNTACIGGKDSMSGTYTFEDDDGKKVTLDVPHTLISFAVVTSDVKNITSGAFKKAGHKVYLLTTPIKDNLTPDFDVFNANMDALYKTNKMGAICAMYPMGAGGVAEAISKMAMGNEIGVNISTENVRELFLSKYGSIIIESNIELDESTFSPNTLNFLGETTSDPAIFIAHTLKPINENVITKIPLSDIVTSYDKTLEKVYPATLNIKQPSLPQFSKVPHKSLATLKKTFDIDSLKTIKQVNNKNTPKVVIPVFYGTNCEYDMTRAFTSQGASVSTIVITNKTRDGLIETLGEFAKELRDAQILALAGGFSAADEPDGSAKFIANCLRCDFVANEITNLINRKSLILGICNGFQALVKTGLVVHGKFTTIKDSDATLTYNTIGRHISRVVRTKIVSGLSPWAQDKSVIDGRTHLIAISHGEGRFVINDTLAKKLFDNGQVFSQYATETGDIASTSPDNPNGSSFGIEGITSSDGLILGKMGHNERTFGALGYNKNILKNIARDNESLCENIFKAGVNYFL